MLATLSTTSLPSNPLGSSKNAGTASGGTPDVPTALALHGMLSSTQAGLAPGSQNPNSLYQQIHDLSNKRIATLDYMRKAHEGRTFWFNTAQFTKSDISRMPSHTLNRLSRRATNYLLLGMSIPTILDMHPQAGHPQNTGSANAATVLEYLRSLNTLLTEFESFQQLHPPDGSTGSSLTRARIPQMFKRATATSRPRKSSGAPVTEIGLPLQSATVSPPAMPEASQHHSSQGSIDSTYTNSAFASSVTTLVAPSSSSAPLPATTSFPTTSAFPPPAPFDAPNSTLLPNEGPYTHLLTPPLPFAPDFFIVFATLCDVLIDTYQRLLQLLTSPAVCTPSIHELFSKVDARIRKIMVTGIVREFENAARDSVRREMMGVQKVVLGGLIGV